MNHVEILNLYKTEMGMNPSCKNSTNVQSFLSFFFVIKDLNM